MKHKCSDRTVNTATHCYQNFTFPAHTGFLRVCKDTFSLPAAF
jgi:hypothetical protein